jgi:alcohol dehydrogenase
MSETTFDFQPRTRIVGGLDASSELGALARDLGFRRTLLVADAGLVAAGQAARAAGLLEGGGVTAVPFHEFDSNPDSDMVERGRAFAASLAIDSIVAWGGGSSLDCAKGINFVLTNGGTMSEYRGFGKAARPMLPMIAVPTTAGTGSEVQTYALISDAATHRKMACGDPKAAFRVAILDPALTVSQPRAVTAVSGFDAIAHAVETAVTRRRNPMSLVFAREAWRRLVPAFPRVLDRADDPEARAAMQLGACLAGMAIECSMLGAAHACSNPLTARYGTTHGIALGILLPQVVLWNGEHGCEGYVELLQLMGIACDPRSAASRLAARLTELAAAAGLPATLHSVNVPEADLPLLAEQAATEWTGTFNPRPFGAEGALEIYRAAY